jgi:hypothetical protein
LTRLLYTIDKLKFYLLAAYRQLGVTPPNKAGEAPGV